MLMLTSFVTSCATTNDYCLLSKKITPTNEDVSVISDKLVIEISKHNAIYDGICN